MIDDCTQSIILNVQQNSDLLRCPRKRLLAFDLARGLAILFMIMQHVVFMFGTAEAHQSVIGSILLGLGTLPAAPVFLFLMGVFYKYSERETNEQFYHGLLKGSKLFALGYCLNLLRFTIPIIFGANLYTFGFNDSEPFQWEASVFIIDILQCAGISMIILAILDRLTNSEWVYAGVAIAVSFISPLLWGRTIGILFLDNVLMIFWGTGNTVLFPVFPFITYPLVGMIFGQYLKRGFNFDRLTSLSKNLGLMLFPLSLIIALRNLGNGFPLIRPIIILIDQILRNQRSDHPSFMIIMLNIGFLFIWLWICNLISKRFPESNISNIVFFWSRNVTVMYVIHWVLIGLIAILIGSRTTNLIPVLFLIGIVLIVSSLITYLYRNWFIFKRINLLQIN
ncbi:MAG: heparan-alpha-glucosaminide N-acetyltransferase domain-containing protein [Candidatus Hodarchaeales archaeon]